MHELLNASEMGRADALTIAAGTPGADLMRRAGEAVARVAQRLCLVHEQAGVPQRPLAATTIADEPRARDDVGEAAAASASTPVDTTAYPQVALVAGPGNNGGDAAVAARCLHERGVRVLLVRYKPEAMAQADARQALASYGGPVIDVPDRADTLPEPVQEALSHAHVIVDGLFGAGLVRPLDGIAALLVQAMNDAPATVLAIDLPSGLNGDTHCASNTVVQAAHTVTFFRLKPAHLLMPGRALCGDLTLAQIGIEAVVLESLRPCTWLNSRHAWQLPQMQAAQHKYERGAVLVRAGALAHSGAGRLSASAALQCGAGLVTLACPGSAMATCAAHLTAVMLVRADTQADWCEALELRRVGVCVIGPGNGVGESTASLVLESLAAGVDCVLDADALSSFAAAPEQLFSAIPVARGQAILTPHDGEFRRLFCGLTDLAPDASRLHRARAAAEACGAVVVLKGPDTVIAHPDGRARINANAPVWLATAGSGDVLAGVAAALLAQGMEAFDAACAAVWLHGQAASDHGYPMTAEQLVSACGRALGDAAQARAPTWPNGVPQ